jgi:DNA-binding HxlR family transcriptional regulator
MTDLARLFHRQWALPMLVAIYRKKDVTVARQTRADTLAALVEQGLLTREGALTARGQKVAERGEALLAVGELRKWSLPILHALGTKARRFGELKAALPGSTPRALSMALKDLAEAGLVERRIVDGFPPRTEYALNAKARALAPLLDQIAKA